MLTKNEIDNLGISNVVVLDTDNAADIYMEKLFPQWCDVYVYTLEGGYPRDAYLRARLEHELQHNDQLVVFLYGARSETTFATASQRRLHMSQLLRKDLRSGGLSTRSSRAIFGFDAVRIAELCQGFSSGFSNQRNTSYNNIMDDLSIKTSVRWYHDLIKS